MINTILFHEHWTNKEKDRQGSSVREVMGNEREEASRSIPLMLTPPPVYTVEIVAAWFTDIICIAKSTPFMHSAANSEALSLLPSAVFNLH